jgi:hypothetical protein
VARVRLMRPYDGGGILRRVHVEIDGEQIARLKQYESVQLELSGGRHTVVARMDWAASAALDIDLADDERLQLEIALPLMAMWDLLQRPQRALIIRRL